MDLSKLKEDSEGVKMLLKDIFSSNKVLVDARGSDSYCEIKVNRNLDILPSKDGFVSNIKTMIIKLLLAKIKFSLKVNQKLVDFVFLY